MEFEQLVDQHYTALFRFALTLSKSSAEAADLTQQTFYLWAAKGHQLRESAKAKSWLFTTLYREYLSTYRHNVRFPHVELEAGSLEIPPIPCSVLNDIDGAAVVKALGSIDEVYQAPLTLFYLEDLSYKEIAEVLDIPIGTVMSRLSRGKNQLRERLLDEGSGAARHKIVPLHPLEIQEGQ